MRAKGRKLTLARLANHDFNRALRIWKRLLPPTEIMRALVKERGKALAFGLRGIGLAVVLMLWLAANKSELNLKIAFLDVAVPSSYVTFALAFLTFGGLINVINYFVLNDFVRIAGNTMFGSGASPALTVLEDGSTAWSAGLSQQYRFFESDKLHKLLGPVVAYFVNVPFLIILLALYWTAAGSGIRAIGDHGLISFETILIIVGWLLLLYPPIHVALTCTPFSFTKNVGYIRWVFLYRLHKRMGRSPSRVNHWLECVGRNRPACRPYSAVFRINRLLILGNAHEGIRACGAIPGTSASSARLTLSFRPTLSAGPAPLFLVACRRRFFLGCCTRFVLMIHKPKTQRIRDPIHEMVVFQEDDPVDVAAWQLLNTPDFQRLRRIKQLGLSDYVYPSATHSRFAHSIGVFHNARRLVKLLKREIDLKRVDGEFKQDRAPTVVVAALLHDVGHGPFSHAFEEARKAIAEARGDGSAEAKVRKHEAFTAEMISDSGGGIAPVLRDIDVSPEAVADLIRAEAPSDMYHAVVSSSFDADRLDYIQRDRYMTGVGTGAIDISWLMDNVRVAEIDVSPGEGTDAVYQHGFCLRYRARDAAEDFLLARYRLYTNVYLHKTTRGMEQLVSALFRELAQVVAAGSAVNGLESDHSLILFFSRNGETLENYRKLDDALVWGAIHSLARIGGGRLKDLAVRILERRRPACVDVQIQFPTDSERQRRLNHKLHELFKDKLGTTVFRDVAKLTLYGAIGADDSRAQKRLMIQLNNGDLREISDFKDATIAASDNARPFERFYFLDQGDTNRALAAAEQIRGRLP